MQGITTHVLDTARGRPAEGVAVTLERIAGDGSTELLGRAATDPDGRVREFGRPGPAATGLYRLTFDTGAWFAAQGLAGFFPRVVVDFYLAAGAEHQHVPLLLSPYGYSTYRGS